MNGITETKNVVVFIVEFILVIQSKKSIILSVPRLLMLLIKAISNLRSVTAEILDLSDEEILELRSIVESTIDKDKDLVPDDIENRVLEILRILSKISKK